MLNYLIISMSLFSPKSTVERHEAGFKTELMQDREFYHEINIRGEDPELLRSQVLELFEGMGYNILINKFTKFEDSEFNNIFDQGRLKPLRAVLSAEKRSKTSSMFPWLWKLTGIVGIIALIIYFLPQTYFDNFNLTVSKEILGLIGVGSLLLSFLFWYIKRSDYLRIWFKASGIYNIEDETSDFKVILSGEATHNSLSKKLNDEITEIFQIISNKYVKKSKKKGPIINVPKKKKDFDVKVIKQVNKVDKDLNELNSQLASGEISEKTYYEVKENLNEKKRKLETILDLINT